MIRKTTLVATTLLCSVFFGQTAHAEMPEVEEPQRPLLFLLGGGLTFGGDDWLDVEYVDGHSDDLTAGGLLDLKVGFRYQQEDSPLVFQSTIGYHFDSVEATNGDADFTRYPLDILAFYANGKHLFGGGITHHMNPKLDIDMSALGFDGSAKLDDETGFVLEYNYKVNERFSAAVRYVDISYVDSEVDGSHGGIYAYLHF